MSDEKIIPKNTTLIITTGEWDTYNVDGLYKTLIDLDLSKLIEEYFLDNPEQRPWWKFHEYDVSKWLLRKGYIEKINHELLDAGTFKSGLSYDR